MSDIKITFLGTCACDFSDKLENEFKNCFDMNARRASSVLINDSFLIDSGMHILDSLRIAKIDESSITDIFITHLHSDHFDWKNIEKIAKTKDAPINIWVRKGAVFPVIPNTLIKEMVLFEEYEISRDARVTGLVANHDPDAHPQHFLFEINGKKIFYGCDGAWLLTPTYNFLKKVELDLAIFDATVGDYVGDYRIAEHNSIPMIKLMLPSLKNERIITEKTILYLSHIAPSLHKPHNEIEKITNAFGAKVAYDGLQITI